MSTKSSFVESTAFLLVALLFLGIVVKVLLNPASNIAAKQEALKQQQLAEIEKACTDNNGLFRVYNGSVLCIQKKEGR